MSPMVEHAMGIEFVPALDFCPDAQGEILNVADTMHRVVAPVEIIVTDESLAAFPADSTRLTQEIVRLPFALPAIFLCCQIYSTGCREFPLMLQETLRVPIPFPPGSEDPQVGSHFATFCDQKAD